MQLLPGNNTTTKLTPVSLNQLWAEAELLGRVKVERNYENTIYSAEIAFSRKSGTRIYAKAKAEDVCFALSDCINEAREMGAGEQ